MIKVEYSHDSHGQGEPPGWELLGKVSTVHETTTKGLAILGIILLGALVELVVNDKFWNRYVFITVTIPKILLGLGIGALEYAVLAVEEDDEGILKPFSFIADGTIINDLLITPMIVLGATGIYRPNLFVHIWPSIILFGVIGTALCIFLKVVTSSFIFTWPLGGDADFFTVAQIAAFVSASTVTDMGAVMRVFKNLNDTSHFIWVFSFFIGNILSIEIFKAFSRINTVESDVNATATAAFFAFVGLSPFLNILFGALIGFVVGLQSAVFTKFTDLRSEYFEVFLILGSISLSHFISLFFGFSFVTSVLVCCLVQKRYAMMNLSSRSFMCTRNIIWALGRFSENVVYILIGYRLFSVNWGWVIFGSTLLFYVLEVLVRIPVTFMIGKLDNWYRSSSYSTKWQFLFVFGGQRGSRFFALILHLKTPSKTSSIDIAVLLIAISVLLDGIISKFLIRQLKLHGAPDHLQEPSKLRNAWHSIENRFVRFVTDEISLKEDYRRKKELDRKLALTRLSKHYVVNNA